MAEIICIFCRCHAGWHTPFCKSAGDAKISEAREAEDGWLRVRYLTEHVECATEGT